MAHATHGNAALTPRARLKMARLIVDDGWKIPRAAERFDVSWKTAKKWADRYREEGAAGMMDRSSRPHHQPNRTPQPVVRKIVHLRWKQRLGRSRSLTGSACSPPPCTPSFAGAGSTASPTSTAPPANPSAATSTTNQAT